MGNRTLPEGMTWEDCRTCGGLTIVSPTGSVNGGTVTCCFECMKKLQASRMLVFAESDTKAGGKSIQNLNVAGSSLQFANVDGGKNGGRATITIHYATGEKSKIQTSSSYCAGFVILHHH